jgi:hypothetical protein
LRAQLDANHRYRLESQGLLVGVIVATVTAVASMILPGVTSRESAELMEGTILIFSIALGVFGSFPVIGIPIWLGLRRLGRGKPFDATIAGLVVAYLAWIIYLLLAGERDFLEILKPNELLGMIAVCSCIGSLVAWQLVYGRKVPMRGS